MKKLEPNTTRLWINYFYHLGTIISASVFDSKKSRAKTFYYKCYAAICALAFISALLPGCISLKSDYPEIQFYRLEQGPPPEKTTAPVEAVLQVRDFTIAAEFNDARLLAKWDDGRLQNYYYHRWIADCSEMITDFFIARFNIRDAFSGGANRASTILTPDYFLEGQALQMIAHNAKLDVPGSNFVAFSIKISLIKRASLKTENVILLNKVFSKNIERDNYSAASIAPAFSKALAEITDEVLEEILRAIHNDRE